MGDADFTEGLKNYIGKYKFKNAEMVDLFSALNEVSYYSFNMSSVRLQYLFSPYLFVF